MMKAPLCLVMSLAVCTAGSVSAADAAKKDSMHVHGTISKIDAKKDSLTVKTTGKDGKAQEKTFQIPTTAKMVDETGKTAKLDSFKNGYSVCITEKDNKVTELKKHAMATITKVDKNAGTVTVKMKDKNGKEMERTFRLVEESEYLDSTGRVAELEIFRSGDEILVIEADGKIQEMKKADDQAKSSASK